MSLDEKIAAVDALLNEVQRTHAKSTFASSLGVEDMVLTDIIARRHTGIEIFSLDTGRLPEETYKLMQQTAERYQRPIKLYFPEHASVEDYVATNGINAFYNSVEMRKRCCYIRKVEPLKRALAGKDAWITGLRRGQSSGRADLAESEFDADNGLQKYNPLASWSEAEVWEYVRRFEVPYSALHDKGYPSIGCAPCTRAITRGEDVRAGRWWWENEQGKECGLHEHKRASQAA